MADKDFTRDHITMLLPLVGRLVEIERDGKTVLARIIGVNDVVHLREVPKGTRE